MKRFLVLVAVLVFFLSSPFFGEGAQDITGHKTVQIDSAKENQIFLSDLDNLDHLFKEKILKSESSNTENKGPSGFLARTFQPAWNNLTKLKEDHPISYPAALFFFLLVLLAATSLYLKLRLSVAIARIPWKELRTDPRVTRWPSEPFFRKIRLWGFLKDIDHVEAILRLRRKPSLQLKKQGKWNKRLLHKYLDLLTTIHCADEARFALGVLGAVGSPRSVLPILNIIRRFPAEPDVTKDALSALIGIRRIKILHDILTSVPWADASLFGVLSEVCRSFGEEGEAFIIKELDHQKSHAIRLGIFRVLGAVAGERAIADLERFLHQGSETERIAAAQAIARIGTETAVQPLIHGLCENPSPSVRDSISPSLADLPREAVLKQLTHLLNTSPKHYSRIRAIQGLEALQPDSSEVLRLAIADPDPRIQAAAVSAMERMGVIQNKLRSYQEEFCEETQAFLVSAGKAGAIEPFLSALKDKESKAVKRTVRLLARIGNQQAVPGLIDLLATTGDWTLKSRLIPALAELDAAEAVPVMVEHLKDKHLWVRKTSMDALSRLLTPDSKLRKETLPTLHSALGEASSWTRASAIRVLTVLEDRSCIPELIRLLRDPKARVRVEAAAALKKLHALEAEDELIALLDDPKQKVSAIAAAALGRFKSQKSLTRLCERFKGAKSLLRVSLLEAVYQIDSTRLNLLLEELKTADRINLRVVRELKKPGSFDSSGLLHALATIGEPEIRNQSIRALADLDKSVNKTLLLSLLKENEAAIRAATVDAIALSQNPDMSPSISEMRNDPDPVVRLRVILALGLIKDPDALPYLRNAVYEKDTRICAHALLALFHYAEPQFLTCLLDKFKEVKARNLIKKIIADRDDPVIALLVDQIPESKKLEFRILKDYTLKSLDLFLEEQILAGKTSNEKLKAMIIAGTLKRKNLRKALKKAILEDPFPEVRAKALRIYSSVTDMSQEKEIIQKAIQDPSLEVQTMASRLFIHFEEEPV
ncbi:MAG: HEAT repeat domain-containing protein [bacterium]